MEKGETINLGSLDETAVKKIIKKFFPHDFSPLKPRVIFRCRDCGVVVLRASLPNVKIAHDPNEEPRCMKCKIKSGESIEVEATILDFEE